MTEGVILVSLPWPRPEHLSIQMASLTGTLKQSGYSVDQHNYASDIRDYLPAGYYEKVVANDLQQYEAAALLFPELENRYEELFAHVIDATFDFRSYLNGCTAFYSDVVEQLCKGDSVAIGFTTSFLQFLPAAWVCRGIKRRLAVKTIVGGASILPDFASDILTNFPQFDYLVIGEGEATLVDLLNASKDSSRRLEDVPGIAFRDRDEVVRVTKPRAQISPLNKLSPPDFSGQRIRRLNLPLGDAPYPTLTVEAARGCFFGKCSFCNLNAQWGNSFRQKSDDVVLEEIKTAIALEKTTKVMFCDTDVSNRQALFERMSEELPGLELLLEVSGHGDGRSPEFFETIRKAGASQIQIGIESFSDPALKKLRKGVTATRNIEMLKWCAEAGIRVFYNLLYGTPGETACDLKQTLEVMRKLWMFEPPARICPYVLAHDSPAHREPEKFNVLGWSVSREVRRCYPEPWMQALAPLFTPIVGYEPTSPTTQLDWTPVAAAADDWKHIFANNGYRPAMRYRDAGTFLTVEVSRAEDTEYIVLERLHKAVFLAADRRAIDRPRLVRELALSLVDIERIISDLVSEELMYDDGVRVLSLPISHARARDYDACRSHAF